MVDAVRLLAFNMQLIGAEPLTGPGHHSVHFFEALTALADEGAGWDLTGFVQKGGERHFSPAACRRLRLQPRTRGRVLRVLFEQLVLPFRVRRAKTDILLNPAFTGPLWGARRIVTIVPDLYFKVIPSLLDRGQRLFFSCFVPICCRLSWKVMVTSRNTASDLVKFYPSLGPKVFVVPLGSKFAALETPIAEPAAETAADPYLLLVANLTANKNPEVVLAAAVKYRSRHGGLRIVHVGRDPLGLLAAAMREHDAGEWVTLERGISDERLAALYRGALALVIPSLYEGFGMPVVEGQSLGVPIICSDRGALPEIGGEGALYFDPHDSDRLAAHVRALATDPALRRDLIARGRANAAGYDWETSARAMVRELGLAVDECAAISGLKSDCGSMDDE